MMYHRAEPKPNSRTVDVAKGIGIALVVVGHYELRDLQPPSWQGVRELIYLFHMPLFMLLSGYLFGYTDERLDSLQGYAAFVKRKIARLVYPYFGVTFILLTLKVAAGAFFELQWPVAGDVLKYIFLNPQDGFAILLWFIYTLFLIFLLVPVLKAVLRSDRLIILLSIPLSFLPWPSLFCLNLVFTYLPFFLSGYVLSQRLSLDELKPREAALGLILSLSFFVPFCLVREAASLTGLTERLFLLLLGVTGSMVCIFVAFLITSLKSPPAKALAALGAYSSIIYLMHTIPMGAARIALFELLKLDASVVLIFAGGGFIIWVAGLMVPLLAQKYLIKPDSFVARYVLGQIPPRSETASKVVSPAQSSAEVPEPVLDTQSAAPALADHQPSPR